MLAFIDNDCVAEPIGCGGLLLSGRPVGRHDRWSPPHRHEARWRLEAVRSSPDMGATDAEVT